MRDYFFSIFLCLGLTSFSQAQLPSYVPENGLLGWWNLDGNGTDESVNTNHLTSFNINSTTDRFNQPNKAILFNGSSSYLSRSSIGHNFSQSGSFTVSLWMLKTSALGGVAVMSGTTTSNNFIWNIQSNTTQGMFGTNKQGSSWFWGYSPNYVINQWEHLVGTYSNGVMKFYKNGTLVSTVNNTHVNVASSSLTYWVGRGVSGNYFNGALDDIGLWNRELSATEINNLYQASLEVDPFSLSSVALYPNPCLNQFNLKLNATSNLKIGVIVDVFGRQVKKIVFNSMNPIDVSFLQSGVYFLKIEGYSESIRFIKK